MFPISKLLFLSAFFVFAFGIGVASQQLEFVAITDNTDWWSLIRPIELGPHLIWQNRMLDKRQLQIGNVQLGEDVRAVRKKLGAATVVARGDAAVSREQICYSSQNSDRFLIFEWGEVGSNVYLFRSGKDWNGKKNCLPSKFVIPETNFANGLKLGLSADQVRRILGRPSRRSSTRLLYFLQAEEKNPGDIDGPVMTTYVDARFRQSQLQYLGIVTSETF
jgi:hypothetical protein